MEHSKDRVFHPSWEGKENLAYLHCEQLGPRMGKKAIRGTKPLLQPAVFKFLVIKRLVPTP